MNQRVKALVDEARKLTPDEQWELLRQLHEVVDDDDEPSDGTPEEIEAAWMEEIERRAAAVERGESQLIDADVVFARIQARLDATKKSGA